MIVYLNRGLGSGRLKCLLEGCASPSSKLGSPNATVNVDRSLNACKTVPKEVQRAKQIPGTPPHPGTGMDVCFRTVKFSEFWRKTREITQEKIKILRGILCVPVVLGNSVL